MTYTLLLVAGPLLSLDARLLALGFGLCCVGAVVCGVGLWRGRRRG